MSPQIFVGLVLLVLPIVWLGCSVHRMFEGEKKGKRSPFTEKLIRPAGESLRVRIEVTQDKMMDRIGVSWDDEFLYVESNGLPDHPMMKGITAWQQQVPIPHNYTGENAFRLPLKPQQLEEPGELTLIGPPDSVI